MVRLLRRLLRLGLVAGVGVGILKVVKGRKGSDPWADSWVSTGAPGATRPSPAPGCAPAPRPPPPPPPPGPPPPGRKPPPPDPGRPAQSRPPPPGRKRPS